MERHERTAGRMVELSHDHTLSETAMCLTVYSM